MQCLAIQGWHVTVCLVFVGSVLQEVTDWYGQLVTSADAFTFVLAVASTPPGPVSGSTTMYVEFYDL